MANSLFDPDHSALLAEQSRVRSVVRRLLWEEYPSHASPRVVEGVCRIVFRRLGIEGEGAAAVTTVAVIGAGMVGSSTAMRIGEARLADRIAIVDVREGVAQAMALDITQALAAMGNDAPLRRRLDGRRRRRRGRADGGPAAQPGPEPLRPAGDERQDRGRLLPRDPRSARPTAS